EEFFHFGKGDDLIQLAVDLNLPHYQNCSIEIDVFPTGQIWVKTSANLQKTRYPAEDLGAARGWFGDSRKNFQQRAFACAVAADDAHDFACLHFKGNVFQSPDDVAL